MLSTYKNQSYKFLCKKKRNSFKDDKKIKSIDRKNNRRLLKKSKTENKL